MFMSISSNNLFNVYFFQPNQTTKKSVGQLPKNFSLADLKKLFEKLFPSPPYVAFENYRFIVEGFDLNVQNETEFNKNKERIKPGSLIYPLLRCVGGSEVDMVTLRTIVKTELPSELVKIPKLLDTCSIHDDIAPCITVCCYKYCAECFINGFTAAKFKLDCPECHKTASYKQVFRSKDFIQTLECLDQIDNYQKCIDYQVCKCGSPMINETIYARQQCLHCKRWFCFFCNNDWIDGEMKNEKYTCRKDCTYEILITQSLFPLTANPALQVPNKRVCPKCYRDGGYGNCCKYNQCHHCELWFCFMCLKPQAECSKTSSHSTKCSEIVPQTYEIFPRLIKS